MKIGGVPDNLLPIKIDMGLMVPDAAQAQSDDLLVKKTDRKNFIFRQNRRSPPLERWLVRHCVGTS